MANDVDYFSKEDHCYMFEKRHFKDKPNSNETMPVLFEGYKRTPEIFISTLFCGLGILIAFGFLRRKAWNYGRLALLHRKRSTWYKLRTGYNVFQRIDFSDVDAEHSNIKRLDIGRSSQQGFSPSSSKAASDEMDSMKESTGKRPTGRRRHSEHRALQLVHKDTGYFTWIKLTIQLSDEDMNMKCGQEAVFYAMFQRMIMLYFSILAVIYIIILLPINLSGKEVLAPDDKFSKLTINNLHPNSDLLWAHCSLLLLSFLFFVVLLRRFAQKLSSMTEERILPAIMITNLPQTVEGNVALIRQYFSTAYPSYRIRNINFAYDVKQYMTYVVHYKNAQSALNGLERYKDDPLIRITHSRRRIKASEYYQEEFEKYRKLAVETKEKARNKPLPICFVTFNNTEHMFAVIKDFKWFTHRRIIIKNIPAGSDSIGIRTTSLDGQLKPWQWFVSPAPDPCDISWENLSTKYWYSRAIVLNLMALIILFFLTTPSWITKFYFDEGKIKAKTDLVYNHFVFELIPVGLFVVFTLLLPNVISLVEHMSHHWTKSSENMSLIRKCTIFLLLMVLALPSIGLTSMFTMVRFISEEALHKNITVWDQLSCAFMADTGAFFFSYISTTAFVSLPIDVIQITVLIKYSVRLILAKSKFEKYKIVWSTIPDFQYGEHYSWMLLIFTIVVVYAPMMPIILMPGLICFVIKYYVDRYTMFFACKPGKMNRNQHLTALNIILFSFLLAQFFLCLFLSLRTRGETTWNWRNAVMIIILLCMIVIYVFHISFGWLWTGVFPTFLLPIDEDALESAKSLESWKVYAEEPLPQKIAPGIMLKQIKTKDTSPPSSNLETKKITVVNKLKSNVKKDKAVAAKKSIASPKTFVGTSSLKSDRRPSMADGNVSS